MAIVVYKLLNKLFKYFFLSLYCELINIAITNIWIFNFHIMPLKVFTHLSIVSAACIFNHS